MQRFFAASHPPSTYSVAGNIKMNFNIEKLVLHHEIASVYDIFYQYTQENTGINILETFKLPFFKLIIFSLSKVTLDAALSIYLYICSVKKCPKF